MLFKSTKLLLYKKLLVLTKVKATAIQEEDSQIIELIVIVETTDEIMRIGYIRFYIIFNCSKDHYISIFITLSTTCSVALILYNT